MSRTLYLKVNTERYTDRVVRETRPTVLSNFPQYQPEELYKLNMMHSGLFVKIDSNRKLFLLKSTLPECDYVPIEYIVVDRISGYVYTKIEVMFEDKPSVYLDDNDQETVVVLLERLDAEWSFSNQDLLSKTDNTTLSSVVSPWLAAVEGDMEVGFVKLAGSIYLSDWIGDTLDEVRSKPYDVHRIFCKIS